MNNSARNGENHRRQQSPAPGHPSLPPQYQHLQHRAQDPQLALLLANAAAARGQPPRGGHPGHLGIGNNHNGGGFANPGHFGNISERHGPPGAMSQSAAAQLFEEQILQRASALRAEALMQQQQSNQYSQQQSQQHHQQLQIQAALKAIQQQQQLSSLNGAGGPAPTSENASPRLKPTDPHQQLLHQQQEAALLARAAALRELGIAGSPGNASPASALLGGDPGLDRLREQLDINALLRHRQQQQQSQQRAPFALEQELERVRQAQRLAAVGSPKPSTSIVSSKAAKGTSAVLGSLTPAPSATNNMTSSSDVAAAVEKAIASSSEASERAVASNPKSPKPTVETSQSDKGGLGTSNRSNQSKSSASSDISTAPPKTGRTTPPLKPNPRTPEKSKQTKETQGAGAAAAAAVRCKTKEELRKNPGTVIVPCRARGMPMDHNFISAFFVIAEDAKHGENLVCSYYACRNGGIKFRYCAYCMAPVAKRNFSRRHDHGMSKKKGANSIREEEEDDEDDDTLGGSEHTASEKGSMSGTANQMQTSVKRSTESSAPETESKRQRIDADTLPTIEKDCGDLADRFSSKRRSMWNNLLNKRPRTKDPKDLSSWLNEVMAVSDLEFPLDQVGGDMGRPFGKLLSDELSKVTKPATPSEDEAVDSNDATDTMDSSPTGSIVDEPGKESTNNENGSTDGDATNSKISDTVVSDESPPFGSTETKIEVKSATETLKDKGIENTAIEEQAASTREDLGNSVTSNTVESNGSGTKLLGKKSKLSPKKSIIAGIEETGKMKKQKDDEGFAGSFADWRDRKKGKSLKKGSSSLRK